MTSLVTMLLGEDTSGSEPDDHLAADSGLGREVRSPGETLRTSLTVRRAGGRRGGWRPPPSSSHASWMQTGDSARGESIQAQGSARSTREEGRADSHEGGSDTPPLTVPPALTLTIEDNDVPVPALPGGGALLLGALLLWRGVRATSCSPRLSRARGPSSSKACTS